MTLDDLELMSIAFCLDYIQEYIESEKDNSKKTKARKASQKDFDSF